MSVLSGAEFLKPVDFTLNGGALPIEPQPFHSPNTFVNQGRRWGRLGGDFRNELGIHRT